MVAECSLYFHFPFCTKKCPYCHFYVVPDRDHASFLEALEREWDMRLPLLKGKKIVSVYFGGGTPSLCLEGIEWILAQVQGQEITVETNPEDVTEEKMRRLKNLGVNRLSIGVQSLSNVLLKTLGREHTAEGAIDAVLRAKSAGIDNITIDLMYELPYQTFDLWKETVDRACALPITHLSLYNLTFEPHTVFKKKEGALRPHLPSDEEAAKMLAYACEAFEKSGLERYEISAFAREGKRSIHNTGYWQGRPFLGFGPSAFSDWEGRRFQNVCHLGKYIRSLKIGKSPVDFEEKLSPIKSLHERIAIALRLKEGVDLSSAPPSTLALMEALQAEGWLKLAKGKAELTEQGFLFYDTVAEKIIL